MSAMVQRVMAALAQEFGYREFDEGQQERMARAAIAAMREPTAAMLQAASDVGPPGNIDLSAEEWAAAIDAALQTS